MRSKFITSAQQESVTNTGAFKTSSANYWHHNVSNVDVSHDSYPESLFITAVCVPNPPFFNLLLFFLPLLHLYFSPPAPCSHDPPPLAWPCRVFLGRNQCKSPCLKSPSLFTLQNPFFLSPPSHTTPPPHALPEFRARVPAVTSCLFILAATLSYLSPPLPPSYPLSFFFLPFSCPQTLPPSVSSLGPPLIYCTASFKYTQSHR